MKILIYINLINIKTNGNTNGIYMSLDNNIIDSNLSGNTNDVVLIISNNNLFLNVKKFTCFSTYFWKFVKLISYRMRSLSFILCSLKIKEDIKETHISSH